MNPQSQNDQALADQAALLSYVDDLIRDRKDPSVNDSNRDVVRQLLLKEVNDEINLRLVNLLSEENQKVLEEMLDKNASDEEINKFFMDKIPNLESEMAAVLLNFRATYLLPVAEQLAAEAEAKNHTPVNTSDLTPQSSDLGETLEPLPPAPVPESKAN